MYDGSGTRVAQVGLAVGPIVTEQPQSQSTCPDAPVTLSVRASGATAYRWESSPDGAAWSTVTGASSSTVTVPGTTAYYRVVTSNAAGSTTSEVAAITAAALATEPASNVLYGDVTRDGAVDAADATLLRSVIAGRQPLPVPLPVADLNGDTRLDALDLALVTAYATSSITCLPQFATASLSAPASITALATMSPVETQAALNPTQYFFYSPEKNLLSHTGIHAGGGTPPVAIDYIWFAGMPVAQETLDSETTDFTFPDHLGTPFLQTSTTGTPTWRVDLEPYGNVWSMRIGDAADQRLRFPGQEFDEQTPERAYNIFRWYRGGWGRYTQSDPMGNFGDPNPYAYALDNPISYADPRPEGLQVLPRCPSECGDQRGCTGVQLQTLLYQDGHAGGGVGTSKRRALACVSVRRADRDQQPRRAKPVGGHDVHRNNKRQREVRERRTPARQKNGSVDASEQLQQLRRQHLQEVQDVYSEG